MDVQQFRLKNLKTDEIPEQFVVTHFDGEKAAACVLTYRDGDWKERYREPTTVFSLPVLLSKFKSAKQLWVVGCNIYQFLCWQGLYYQFECEQVQFRKGTGKKNKGKITGAFATGSPTIVDVSIGEKNVHIVDLDNWAVEPQKNLDDTVQYLKDLIRMVEELQMGSLANTSAGQGLNRLKRHDLLNHKIYCHQDAEVRELERDAYYGGRSEAKFVGQINTEQYHLDFKSQYAFIASKESFPYRLLDKGYSDQSHLVEHHTSRGRHVIAKVVIETGIPVFPVRTKSMTCYPIGKFATTLCWPELQLALKMGVIKEIRFWAAYEVAPIFQENAQWFFEAKEKLKELGLSHMGPSLKHAQNSMYGGIGRRGKRWLDMPRFNNCEWGEFWMLHPVTGELTVGRAMAGWHQYLDSGLEPKTSNPAISATMCSYSKVMLWETLSTCGHDNWSYCDTDGFICDESGVLSLGWDENKSLYLPGELTLREKGSDVEIRGNKYYRFEKRWSQAGVPPDAERDQYGNASWTQIQPFASSLWEGAPFSFKQRIVKGGDFPRYKHGHVLGTGKVIPLVCDFWLDPKTGLERNRLSNEKDVFQ